MNRCARVVGVVVLLGRCSCPRRPRAGRSLHRGCQDGVLPQRRGRSLICVPPGGWNGQLVVFAPGYTPPQLPLDFYYLARARRHFLPMLVQRLGYAFATTTFRKNGLAVLEGVDDIRSLAGGVHQSHRSAPRCARTSPACPRAGWSRRCWPSGRRSCSPARWRRARRSAASVSRSTTWATSACSSTTTSRACCRDRPWRCRLAGRLVRLLGLHLRARDPDRACLANPAKALELMRVSHVAYRSRPI